MNHNDIVIYGFNLGNSDPAFKEFVYSLSNYDVHNLRMILYKQLYKLEQNRVSAAIHGRDSYGIIIVPEVRKKQLWEKSDKLLFNYIKDLWVASVLGFSDPGINPIKNHQWRITRIRAVTTRNEGWEVITSTVLEVGLAYLAIGNCINIKYLKNINPQRILKRDYFKIHPRISHPGKYGVGTLRGGQMDVGHRASTFFSDEVINTGKIGVENYRTIYFNKQIGDKNFSVGLNPWKRTIFHEGPGIYIPRKK